MKIISGIALAVLAVATVAQAQLTVPSQGWDGNLVISTNTTIDLAAAADGDWSTQPIAPGWTAGDGIYDPNHWAVVFHYTSVSIATGAKLTFTNHPSGAPVIWLVGGAVSVDGTIDLDGGRGVTGYPPNAGPGGFRGGNGNLLGVPSGGGFGPGGALRVFGYDASFSTPGTGGAPTYGTETLVPLIGGSGGCGFAVAGGAGGGAILIASSATVTVAGEIHAKGGASADSGAGRGSGGAIRIVAESIVGAGSLIATGGDAGAGEGRIRLEAVDQVPSVSQVFPAASLVVLAPGTIATIWPAATEPSLRLVSLNGIPVPSDPEGTLSFPWQDIALSGGNGDVTVLLEGSNVPANSVVNLFLTPLGGDRLAPQPASFVSLAGDVSTWQFTFSNVANGISAIQARAILP